MGYKSTQKRSPGSGDASLRGVMQAGFRWLAGLRSSSLFSRAIWGTLLTGVLGQAALMVSGVLAARALGVEDRGHLALLVIVPTLMSILGGLGLPTAVTFFIARDRHQAGTIAASIAPIAALQAVLLLAIHAMVLVVLLGGKPSHVGVAGASTLLSVPALLAQQYGLGVLQGQQRFDVFNALRLLPVWLYSMSVLALFALGWATLEGIAIAWTVSSVLPAGLTLAFVRRGLSGERLPDEAPSRPDMTRFGLRSMVGWVSPLESLQLDQLVVGLFLSPAALGMYVVGVAFTNLPRFISGSLGLVSYPRVASQKEATAAHRTMWRYVWLTAGLCAAIVVVLELAVGRLVPMFFGTEFRDAVPVTRILLIGGLFLAARRALADGVRGAGQPFAGTTAELASWPFLLIGLLALTPAYGLKGVALSMSIASAGSLLVLVALVVRGGTGD